MMAAPPAKAAAKAKGKKKSGRPEPNDGGTIATDGAAIRGPGFAEIISALGALYNSDFAFNRTLQFLSGGLVSFALIGGDCLLDAIKLDDHRSLGRSALKRLRSFASDNGSPSLRLQCRASQLGVFGKSGGIRNGSVPTDPIGFGHRFLHGRFSSAAHE